MTATIIAIDGPAGVGKSSVARRLAARLGLPYLDTGAMYRAAAHEALRRGLAVDDEAQIEQLMRDLHLELSWHSSGPVEISIEGRPIGQEIRAPEVSAATSRMSAFPCVRERMVARQQRFGRRFGGVLEGRDIGTVVFPEAPFKFFLDATLQARSRRRGGQLSGDGRRVDLDRLAAEMHERDRQDSERELAPLRRDSSYHYVETSDMTLEEVVEHLAAIVEESVEGARRSASTTERQA